MAKVIGFSKLAAITCGTLLLSNAAQASFVGDTITLSVAGDPDPKYYFTSLGTTTVNAVVGAGVEAKAQYSILPSSPDPGWNIDVGESSFTITNVDNGAGFGPELALSDLNWITGGGPGRIITGVNLTAVSVTGLTDASILAFGDDFVTVDLGQGGGGELGWSATYTMETTVIPVPAAVWLFGSGLLGLIGIARRKAA